MRLSEHFVSTEFACHCGCGYGTRPNDVSTELIDLLERMREEHGPIHITSGCRCKVYNLHCGGVENSAHTRGTAADLRVQGGTERRKLLDLAVMNWASGIGVANSFIHVDMDSTLPRPMAWTY